MNCCFSSNYEYLRIGARLRLLLIEYQHDYLIKLLDDLDTVDHRAVSVRFPLSFDTHDLSRVPD